MVFNDVASDIRAYTYRYDGIKFARELFPEIILCEVRRMQWKADEHYGKTSETGKPPLFF